MKMNLKIETIFDFYTHKNRKIFCQIKVLPSKNHKLENTCRSITSDQWSTFDKELEKLLDGINSSEDGNKENLGKFIIRPNIEVKVQRSKLSLKYFRKLLSTSEDCEKDILGNSEDKDIAVVLECVLDLQNESKLYATKCVEPLNENVLKYKPARTRETRNSRDSDKCYLKCVNDVKNETNDKTVPLQIYRPLRLKSKKNISNEIDIKSKNKEHIVEDMQTNIRNEININFTNENFKGTNEPSEILPNCSKKNFKKRSKTLDSIPGEIEMDNGKLSNKTIIKEDKKTENSDLNSHEPNEKLNELNKICTATNGKGKQWEKKSEKVLRSISSSEDEHFSELPKRAKKQTKTHSTEVDDEFKDSTKIDKKSLHEPALFSPELNATNDSSPTKDVRKSNKTEQPNTTSLRRSDRSPSKPKRFLEEIGSVDPNRQKKPKKIKSSPKNKELFGSDDDDDEDENDFENNVDINNIAKKIITAPVFETPICKQPIKCSSSSSSSSGKKRRKADCSTDCEQEKRDISKWLSKKKTSIVDMEAGTSKVSKKSERSKSPLTKFSKKSKSSKKPTESKEICSKSVTSACDNFDMPSKKELEEIRNKSKLKQKENEKLKAELDKMRATPPKEVENLSLKDMSLNDILDTFSTYRSELDEIYKKNCKRDYIKGHDGINHCFVIQLLQQNVQMKMLEKLTDVYSNSSNTMQATLYANALLPEWIIRVYMEKFNFTRQEAINQIKAQDDYRLHMEEQSDGSFMFN